MTHVRRGFVDIEEGQIHYRTAGEGEPPLVMFHMSPKSSRDLLPLIVPLSRTRQIIAPDTLGNGHSSPPTPAEPDLLYFADAHLRALDELGVERFDAYGAHTGAKIALELAITHPDRVRKLIFDGVSLRSADAADELISGIHAVEVDHDGTHLMRAWHLVRDAYLFFPWFEHTAQFRTELGLPDPESLHEEVVELLAAMRTYHLSEWAAIRHMNQERLPLITVPTLVACAESDHLFRVLDAAAALVPNARKAPLPFRQSEEFVEIAVRAFSEFLDE